MKIFLCCSKAHYPNIPPIKVQLEKQGHTVVLPNSYDHPSKEQDMKDISSTEHQRRKSDMLHLSIQKIYDVDAIFVLNLEKNGQKNYIGGATFLEVFKTRELGKKIFFYNPIPDGILYDELSAMAPMILDGDIEKMG